MAEELTALRKYQLVELKIFKEFIPTDNQRENVSKYE